MRSDIRELKAKMARLVSILHGRLSWAPMEYVPSFVLDIGTGTGIWVNEFG